MKEIEFLPEHHVRARVDTRLRFTRIWLLAVLGLAMVCLTVHRNQRLSLVRGQFTQLETELSVVDAELERLSRSAEQKEKFVAQRKLVLGIEGSGPRHELIASITAALPREILLTRFDVESQSREVSLGAGPGRPAVVGVKAATKMESYDRVRVEGFAADDLALARFLQELNEAPRVQQCQLAFSKDAAFRGKDVRVFAATFYVAPEGVNLDMMQWAGGRR
jgi:Tfp pilus assembly protein PilN